MPTRSTGRGTAALFGLLVVLAGLIGAAVLYVMSQRRPEQAVDEFARAPVGCTTTLEFTDTGTFYVFEERSDVAAEPLGDCQPVADPQAAFGFVLRDAAGVVDGLADLGVVYEFGARSGQSVSSFEVNEPGRYEIAVVGNELTVVAAIGRDPDESVSDLRRAAIAVGLLGLVIGGALLFLSGRRSRQAAAPSGPPAGGTLWQRPSDIEASEHAPPPVAHVPASGSAFGPPAGQPAPPPEPTLEPGAPTQPAPWGPPSADAGDDRTSPPT